MTAPTNADLITTCLVQAVLNDDRGMTARELAVATLLSEKTVRKELETAPLVFETSKEAEYRTSFSRDYPGMETGGHRVTVFRLSRRAIIKRLKSVLNESKVTV